MGNLTHQDNYNCWNMSVHWGGRVGSVSCRGTKSFKEYDETVVKGGGEFNRGSLVTRQKTGLTKNKKKKRFTVGCLILENSARRKWIVLHRLSVGTTYIVIKKGKVTTYHKGTYLHGVKRRGKR